MYLHPSKVSAIASNQLMSNLDRVLSGILKIAVSISLSICLLLLPFAESAQAGRTLMSGDYVNDTVTVSKSLKETISAPPKEENQLEQDKETVFLITDYISRYRNRPQVNEKLSFTTMQTALNSLAGHYKTFPNRPVPEKLKDRLNDELSKAEDLVLKKS